MSTTQKIKKLFLGEKTQEVEKSPPKRPPLKPIKGGQGKEKLDNEKAKAEIEIFQKKIKQKLKDDPELQKKAAMIISQMINKK
jgi:hypothetical protein